MNRALYYFIQVVRVITAALAVLWAISLLNVYFTVISQPSVPNILWMIAATAVVAVPGLIYWWLTKVVEREKARRADLNAKAEPGN